MLPFQSRKDIILEKKGVIEKKMLGPATISFILPLHLFFLLFSTTSDKLSTSTLVVKLYFPP